MSSIPSNRTDDPRDYRDICVQDLALELTIAEERIRSLEADVASYRELSHHGIQHLAALTQDRDRLRRRLDFLRQEFQDLQAQCRRLTERRAA